MNLYKTYNNKNLLSQFNEIFTRKERRFVEPSLPCQKIILRGKSKNYTKMEQFDIKKLQGEGNATIVGRSKLHNCIIKGEIEFNG